MRPSETAHASDFPSAAIQQLCTASSASSASSCPVIGRPNPKTIIPGKAPEEAGREMGRPHVEQDMNRPGLAGSFQSQRVKNVQVISGC